MEDCSEESVGLSVGKLESGVDTKSPGEGEESEEGVDA